MSVQLSLKGLLKRVTLVGAATSLVAIASTGTAQASGYGSISSNSGGAYIRAQPYANAMTYGYFGNGTSLYIYCYRDAGWALGNYWTNRWFQTNVPSYRYGSPEAYISASVVWPQPAVPRC